jgi:glutathione S-transferase
VLEDRVLPESAVIMEYLEDRFPEPAMCPADIDARATMNLFYRFPDSYIQPALFPLFSQVFKKTADDEALKGYIAALKQQVNLLDELMGLYEREIEHDIDLADCTFAANFFFARLVPGWFEEGVDVLADAPRVQAWWDWCTRNEHSSRVLLELETGFNAFLERMNFKK